MRRVGRREEVVALVSAVELPLTTCSWSRSAKGHLRGVVRVATGGVEHVAMAVRGFIRRRIRAGGVEHVAMVPSRLTSKPVLEISCSPLIILPFALSRTLCTVNRPSLP